MSKKVNFFGSFKYAGNGVKAAFKDEPNFRFHTLIGILVIILAIIFKFSPEKFAILILTIAFVIILELVNTSIEEIVNEISPNYSLSAKLIKDVSAAAVLISALAALAVGLVLFLPSIFQFLSGAIH